MTELVSFYWLMSPNAAKFILKAKTFLLIA